jgi:ligand-binding sensor domain-containing protein
MKQNRLLSILFISIFLSISAQNTRWIDHFSYLDVHHIQTNEQTIIAQSDNAIFTYNTNSGEIEKFSSVNGLSGNKISNFYYDADSNKTFIFDKGGLIEVIDAQKNVHKSPDLAYNAFVPAEKKVLYDVVADNQMLYLATGYGISVYNLDNYEFGDTYYTGNNGAYEKVYSIRFFDQKIFIATENGLKYADKNANLLDFSVWTNIAGLPWTKLRVVNNKLLGEHWRKIYEITNSGVSEVLTFNEDIGDVQVNDYICVSFPNKVKVFDLNYSPIATYNPTSNINFSTNTSIDLNQEIYIGSRQYGLLKINNGNYEEIHPNCPQYNYPFAIDVQNQNVWVVYGKHSSDYAPHNMLRGVSTLQGETWTNIRPSEIGIRDICYVKANPSNPDIVYLASVGDGILKLNNNVPEVLYTEHNSPLINDPAAKIRMFAMDFDENLNLWLSERVNNARPLFQLKNDGSWNNPNLYNIFGLQDIYGFGELLADKQNHIIWLGTTYKGVVGYQVETGRSININKGIEPASYTNITAMAIDKDNVMWIGNHQSLKILRNPEKAFTDPDASFKPIKIEYEGSVQLLMNGQNITSIKVDGSNNKWIGTLGSGVYYFSEDGNQTIYHFNAENSPLPSNDVLDIGIDGTKGIVYFATSEGLIAFKGNATDAGENMDDVYAFPNPVNMQKHNFVTIRGLVENVSVKIVDIEGNLVYETTSKGGSIDWDLTAFGKYKVASGVYIALISDEYGEQTQTTKILVIR